MRQSLRYPVEALLATLVLSGCAASQQQLELARQQGASAAAASAAASASAAAASARTKAQQQQLAAAQRNLERQIQELKKQRSQRSTPASSGSGSLTSCGNNLSVNSKTTCQFANDVYSDWLSAGAGTTSFWSYSPVTQQTYWMSCVAGVPTVCTGGNDARVDIR